jgi:DUF4097 and DUF4098 domain-containing protein YvlB
MMKKGEFKMKNLAKIMVVYLALFLGMGNSYAQEEEEMHKTFKAKRSVRIQTVSGDCVVKRGSSDKIQVDLVYSVEPKKSFEPEFQERGDVLRLKERWYGSSSGEVIWTLTVPPKTEIDFSTASGDLSIDGMTSSFEANTASGEITVKNSEGQFDFSTASGDIILEDSQGEFDLSTASGEIEAYNIGGLIDLSTASGDIDVTDSKGTYDLSCASGNIDASDILVEEESFFSTASGKVYVKPAESPEYDLELSSASGNVTLDYNGNPIKGYFEFTARKRRGRIVSPVAFDKEEEFERHDRTYVRKSFTKGSGEPRIYIETASGRAILKK